MPAPKEDRFLAVIETDRPGGITARQEPLKLVDRDPWGPIQPTAPGGIALLVADKPGGAFH